MKLEKIKFENFKAYKKLDLSLKDKPNIILFYGNNGLGKTSLFDGIEWGITGEIKRYSQIKKNSINNLRRVNTDNQEKTEVTIEFSKGYSINREIIYKNDKLTSNLIKPLTEDEIIENISFEKSKSLSLNENFNFLYLLSQDLITDYVKVSKSQDKYERLATLFGMGKENELLDILKLKIKEARDEEKNLQIEIGEIEKEISKINISGKSNLNKSEELKGIEEKYISLEMGKLLSLYKDKKVILEEKQVEKDQLLKKQVLFSSKDYYEEKIRRKIKLEKRLEKLLDYKKMIDFKELVVSFEKYLEKNDLFSNYEYLDFFNLEKELELWERRSVDKDYYELFVDRKVTFDRTYRQPLHRSISFQNEYVKMSNILSHLKDLNNEKNTIEKEIKRIQDVKYQFYSLAKEVVLEVDKKCPLCDSNINSKEEILGKLEERLKDNEFIEKYKYKYKLEEIERDIQNEYVKKELLEKDLENKIPLFFDEEKKSKKSLREIENQLNQLNDTINKIHEEYGLANDAKYYELLNKAEDKINGSVIENYKEELFKTNKELFELKKINIEEYQKVIKEWSLEDIRERIKEMIASTLNIEIEVEALNNCLKIKKEINGNRQLQNLKSEKENLERKLEEYEILGNEMDLMRKKVKKGLDTNFMNYKSVYGDSIKNFYKYLNPHKQFKEIGINIKNQNIQRNKLDFFISGGDEEYNPALLLSTAQSNNLALSVFLGINLATKELPLDLILMDDPIQNMDDINIHSFIEILKQIALYNDKQILISTHDEKIAKYMQSKLKGLIYSVKLESYGVIAD